MGNKSEGYKRYYFIAIILISLGVIYSTTLKDTVGSLGTVFIALGSILILVALSKKRREVEHNDK